MESPYADIALLDCGSRLDPYSVPAMLELAGETRRQKIAAQETEQDRRLSLGAGLLARLLLLRRGIAPDSLSFDSDGRPTVPGAFLSLSHGGRYAMAGLSSAPIGVDVEPHQPERLNIADHFFTAEERRQLEESPDRVACFFQIWSRKECLIKRDGLRDLRELPTELPAYRGLFHDISLPGNSCVSCVGKEITPRVEILDWERLIDRLKNL